MWLLFGGFGLAFGSNLLGVWVRVWVVFGLAFGWRFGWSSCILGCGWLFGGCSDQNLARSALGGWVVVN